MRLPWLSALGLIAALAAGSVAAQNQWQADGPACAGMFRQFDVLETLYPSNGRRYQNRVAPPPVLAQAQILRNAGCITLTRELAGMEVVALPAVTDSGPAIAPVGLHAGVVTNMADDARARAFFESKGVRARSVGSAPLGRRIYLGPFATQGALDQAAALAIAAGFASPYPASF